MNKRFLLLAYMFPPIVDGGAFRPLSFARYLPEFGYEPTVLTRPDSGGLKVDPGQLDGLPAGVRIERVKHGFADGWSEKFRRPLAWLNPVEVLFGRPKNWIADAAAWRVARKYEHLQWEASWMHPAIDLGLELIRRDRPEFLLATAPPFETLKAGLILHRKTGIPLIADFRDPWTYGYLWNPSTERRARGERSWESNVVKGAAKVLVVTPTMQRTMVEHHPDAEEKVALIMNGYEESLTSSAEPPRDRFVLSYAGIIVERRLPPEFFEALRIVRTEFPAVAPFLRVQLIGHDACATPLTQRIAAEDVADMVEWLGSVSQERARELMRQSHLLLHIESSAQYAISGKLFEYLAARRPVLGMTPKGSDDEWFLNESGAGVNVGLGDARRIATAIYECWKKWKNNELRATVDETWLRQFHRREQARKLAQVLGNVHANS